MFGLWNLCNLSIGCDGLKIIDLEFFFCIFLNWVEFLCVLWGDGNFFLWFMEVILLFLWDGFLIFFLLVVFGFEFVLIVICGLFICKEWINFLFNLLNIFCLVGFGVWGVEVFIVGDFIFNIWVGSEIFLIFCVFLMGFNFDKLCWCFLFFDEFLWKMWNLLLLL